MQVDRLEQVWVEAFVATFLACKAEACARVVILSESQSRPLNVALSENALSQIGARFFHIKLPHRLADDPAILRSTGASGALEGMDHVVETLSASDLVVDLTVEGLMHAPQTPKILGSGARILNISNEHPDILSRMLPDDALKEQVRQAAKQCKSSKEMRVSSSAGTELTVDMTDANTVGVWGWTDRPGTLAHWPGGLVVSFPKAGAVNGTLVFKPGDMNLTFKRYFEGEVICNVENDFIVSIDGIGADARLMRSYLDSFGDRNAYATSHVGWGLNKAARYEALAMYDKADLNGTELRATAGNFLYSTGANEFAKRFTKGHFDLPMMDCTIKLDGVTVVDAGKLT